MCQADHASGHSYLLEESETNVDIKCKDQIYTSSNGRWGWLCTWGKGGRKGQSKVLKSGEEMSQGQGGERRAVGGTFDRKSSEGVWGSEEKRALASGIWRPPWSANQGRVCGAGGTRQKHCQGDQEGCRGGGFAVGK